MVLILHVRFFSFVGLNILLKIFFSKIISFCFTAALNTHVSEAYITTDLITVLYSLSLDCLVTNLLFRHFLFAKYALLPSAILSLICSSMGLLLFIMDPRYLNCFTCSRCILSVLRLWVLVSFFEHFKYFVSSSFINSPNFIHYLLFTFSNIYVYICTYYLLIYLLRTNNQYTYVKATRQKPGLWRYGVFFTPFSGSHTPVFAPHYGSNLNITALSL